ncbi:MAG: LysM peptidoglycan-binding domain-containing protein [Anaerolineae bacterium]
MAERDFLTEVFNDCVERMRAGASIDECLSRYPEYAADLRPMLLSAEAVRRARVSASETQQAQLSARFRFEAEMQQDTRRRRGIPVLARYAAAAVAILVIGSGVLAALSQSALPGDPLYGIKRAGEQMLMALAGSTDSDRLSDRRVEEIQALLTAGRTEEVTFDGEVSAQNAGNWQIGGLSVTVPDDLDGAEDIHVGDRVRVSAFTTPNGDLIAHALLLLERGLQPPTSTPVPPTPVLPTLVPTSPATSTPFPVPSQTIIPTVEPPPTLTASPSATAIVTLMPTASATRIATRTATPTPSPTPTPIRVTPSATVCTPVAPAGWVLYRVQAGDTLSGLAATTGITTNQLLQVNCLTVTTVLMVGQPLYLPSLPATVPPTVQPTDDSGHDAGDDHSGSDDSSDSNSGSGSSNSGSGSSDDHSDG